MTPKITPQAAWTESDWTHHLPSKSSLVGITFLLMALVVPILMYNDWISLGKPLTFIIACVMSIVILREFIDQMEGREVFKIQLHFWLPLRTDAQKEHLKNTAQDTHLVWRFLKVIFYRGKWFHKELCFRIPENDRLELLVKIALGAGFLLLPIVFYTALSGLFSQFSATTSITFESIGQVIEEASALGTDESGKPNASAGIIEQTIANFIDSVRKAAGALVGEASKSILKVTATYGNWLIAIFVISTAITLPYFKKEVKHLEYMVQRSVPNEGVQRNIFNYSHYYKETLGGLAIAYSKVATLLTVLFFILLMIVPLNMGISAIILMSVLLGFVTAVPKIGGFVGLGIAGAYMLLSPGAGFCWSWIEGTTSLTCERSIDAWLTGDSDEPFKLWLIGNITTVDHIVRTCIFMAIAKVLGVFEAYRFTPNVLGEQLGVSKMTVIFVVIMYAKLGGISGLIWGFLMLTGYLSALRLDNNGLAPGRHGWIHGSTRTAAEQKVTQLAPSLKS